MDISVDKELEAFIKALVQEGRFRSPGEVVSESLRMMKQHEMKLQALRNTINASITRGGSRTDEEVATRLERVAEELRSQSF
jgi:antitoxin ParD1/3/4